MACTTCNKQNVFEKAKAIATGTLNYVFENPEIEALALPRLELCKDCPFARVLITVGTRKVVQCTKCDCLTELKARDRDEVCPVGKW